MTRTRYSHILSPLYTDDELTPDTSLPRRCWGHYDGQWLVSVLVSVSSLLRIVSGKIIVTTEAESREPLHLYWHRTRGP